MTPNKLLLFSLLLFPYGALAQFGLGKKRAERTTILNTPTIGDYALQDPEYKYAVRLRDGYPDEKSAWIVYSDRDNNTTYQKSGKEKQPLASLSFMQACFVIGEEDDYLELAEYVPRINMSKGKKTLENPKYLGWVNKNTLLLWNRALKDKVTNYYLKTITAFGTQRIFDVLQHHVAGDSIITFANPFLNQPAGKCSSESIFYLYKESVIGNEYLVGPDPNFLPENSAQSRMGWVSKDLVRVWGTRGFITLNPDLEATLPFYQNYPSVKNNVLEQEPISVIRSPYTIPKSDLEKLYPILKYNTTKEGRVVIGSSFLEDALDKGKNRVYNISGDLISNEDIEQFNANSSKLNIVLVVSAGRRNGQYINSLQGVLETDAWQQAARDNFKEVNVGAVVYKDYGPNCDNAITPLTNDYRSVDEFLSEQRKAENDGCDDNNYYQGMYGGIVKAARMLQGHSHESNIILVYGSGSDETSRKGEAIRAIQSVSARLLFFQTHNIPNEPAYINFVGDAKELIAKSSENITELKKKIIVPNTYPNILNGVAFVNDSTGRVQQLDYPRKAITQGFLMFPHDSENMPAQYLANYLDSLITSIATDNRTVGSALRSAIAQSGSGNTKIKKEFAYRFPKYMQEKIPLEFLKSNTLRDQRFLIPAWITFSNDAARNTQPGLSSGILLSEKEYADFANQLAMLGGSGSYDSKDAIVKQIVNAVEKTQAAQNISLDKSAKELTFAEALGFVSGYYPVDPVWAGTTLETYQSSEKISRDIGKVFLEECKRKAVWLHDHNNNVDLQVRNNGRVYYIINETYLPVNTMLIDHPAERTTAAGAPGIPGGAKEIDPDKGKKEDIGTIIGDYSKTKTDVPGSVPAKKSAEDILKAKAATGKDKKDADSAPGGDAPTAGRNTPKKAGNMDKINEDLNAAPEGGRNTASKEKNGDNHKSDTAVNYRKQIASREPEDNKKEEQPKRNMPDTEQGTRQSEQDNTASKQPEAPAKKQKEIPRRNTADFEKDLKELQSNTPQGKTPSDPKPLTAPKVGIKKGNTDNINAVQDDLGKTPVVQEKSKSEKSNIMAAGNQADSMNSKNTAAQQKKEDKKSEKQKAKQYSDVDNDLKQLQQPKGDPVADQSNGNKEPLKAPNVRIKTATEAKAPAGSSGSKGAAQSGDDFNDILKDLDDAKSPSGKK